MTSNYVLDFKLRIMHNAEYESTKWNVLYPISSFRIACNDTADVANRQALKSSNVGILYASVELTFAFSSKNLILIFSWNYSFYETNQIHCDRLLGPEIHSFQQFD